jgi:type I restriction enzyme S subunit
MEMKPGYKQTEVGVIPEEWVSTTVGQMIADGLIEKPLDGNHGNIHPKSSDFVDSGIPFVMANNVQEGRVDLVNCSFIRKRQADSLQKGFSRTGDVLLTHKATIGNTAIVGEIPFPYIMLTPQVTYYRVADRTRLSNLYLRHFFDSSGFQSMLRALSGGGTRAYIGISAQHQLPVVLPPNPNEQRAIAEALSDVDELVAELDRLIAKKRDLKQAAMQRLLTGQTRLPGFHGEWNVSSVGHEFEVKLGKMLDAEKNSGVPKPYVGNKAVQWDRIDISDLPTVPMSRTDIERFRLKPGDLLVCEGGEVGRAAIWEAPIDECYYQKAIHRLRPLRGFNSRFMAALLRLWSDRGMFSNYVTQTSIAHLPREKFIEMPLLVPSPQEQSAIAKVSTDMDAELAALGQRREKTRALKQAMMQELLTGRTRLV